MKLILPSGDEPEDTVIEDPKVYEPIESFESLKERLTSFTAMYNEATRGAGMDLVFFKVRVSTHSLFTAE